MAQAEAWFPAANEIGVVGRFEYYDQVDIAASKAADETKTKQIIVCWAKVVGDPNMNPIPMKPHNRQALINRFPDAWRAFNGESIPVNGTPLTELGLHENKILDFRINSITSVEQLSQLSDAQCEAVGFGTRKLRADAQALLAKRKDDQMAAVLAGAETPPKNKGGRPSNAAKAARAAAEAA